MVSFQSISSPGSGIWSDGKDKNDVSQPHTWNVEVFIDIVKEVVSELCLFFYLTLADQRRSVCKVLIVQPVVCVCLPRVLTDMTLG